MTAAPQREVDWSAILETAVTTPGSVGDTYNAVQSYSYGNYMFLLWQGCPVEPVANFQRWKDVGRHVVKGASAYHIIRPITVKLKDQLDDEGNPKKITKFKPSKSAFPVSMTEGEDLPPIEHPEWHEAPALRHLDIQRVPFQSFDSSTQGYSFDRNVAISPIAKYPRKTLLHEVAHVTLGHTVEGRHEEYERHRGVLEFEAEATAHLVSKELGISTPQEENVSRGYIQSWMRGERPDDKHIRNVFKATEAIISAGRLAVEDVQLVS